MTELFDYDKIIDKETIDNLSPDVIDLLLEILEKAGY
jgi:hypothetical protein